MIFRYDEKLVRLISPKTAVWREVERGPRIKYDLERTVLFIKTNSTEGSGDELALEIFSLQKRSLSAGFSIFFTTPPKYRIFFCVGWYGGRHFPTAIPPATDKVWMITLRKTTDIRLVIHCNDVEVLNLLINDSTCTDRRWDFWRLPVWGISFSSYPAHMDKASDFYSEQFPSSKGNVFIYERIIECGILAEGFHISTN